MTNTTPDGPKPDVEVSSPLEKQRDVWVEAEPVDATRRDQIGATVWSPEAPVSPYLGDPIEPSLVELASILGVGLLFDADAADD
jgi:hypothetical protein